MEDVSTGPEIVAWIATASQRFGLPQSWIRAVMRAESAFDPRATSHAGAMGLMQVMPDTYAELRTRYGLGPDPYSPADNILAGAAYLRELYDRYGPAGFLAAYNAGPGRYREHLETGRPLPRETRLYVARITAGLDGGASEATPGPTFPGAPSAPADPAAAPIFVDRGPARERRADRGELPRATLFPTHQPREADHVD
jgi:hypothetical protein